MLGKLVTAEIEADLGLRRDRRNQNCETMWTGYFNIDDDDE